MESSRSGCLFLALTYWSFPFSPPSETSLFAVASATTAIISCVAGRFFGVAMVVPARTGARSAYPEEEGASVRLPSRSGSLLYVLT